MEVLTKYVCTELIVKNSRFINEAFVCRSQNEAREIIKNQKTKYADATHVVHAFVIGKSGEVMGMSDAGEPSGTAGRPMLDVLKGRKCTDILVTVTRYFGGTLLGTGGLVKAYGDSCKSVLEKAGEEGAFEELVPRTDFSFQCDYGLYEILKRTLEAYHILDLHEDFGEKITVSAKINSEEFADFSEKVRNLSKGEIIPISL